MNERRAEEEANKYMKEFAEKNLSQFTEEQKDG